MSHPHKDEVIKVTRITDKNADELLKEMEFKSREEFKTDTGLDITEFEGNVTVRGNEGFFYIENVEELPKEEVKTFTYTRSRVYEEPVTAFRNGPDLVVTYDEWNKKFN